MRIEIDDDVFRIILVKKRCVWAKLDGAVGCRSWMVG